MMDRSVCVRWGIVVVAAAVASSAGCYDYSYGEESPPDDEASRSGDGTLRGLDAGSVLEEHSTSPDETPPGEKVDAGASGKAPVGTCVAGALHCGGNGLEGLGDTLYRCNAGGSATLVAKCANGCAVTPKGQDDQCNPPTPCVVGGDYCGGDKINGEPDVLYDCGPSGAISVIRRCVKGCIVSPPGKDDLCRP